MSSRKSSSSGGGLPSSMYGERTPLRSLDNEILHLSTPTRFKSKSQPKVDSVKITMGDIALSQPDSHLHSLLSTKGIQTNPPTTDKTTTQTACGLGDVTFKSFICAGGEFEISGSSFCAEESIILPRDQAAYNNKPDNTVTSHSMIEQSCCDHIEHPYHIPEMEKFYSVDISAECLCEIPNTTLASGDLDNEQATQDSRAFQNDCSGQEHVTWKSFVCDGGEVEVSDATRLHNETIPLPKAEFGEPLQDNSVNSISCPDDSGQLCQVEHAEHPYSENDIVPVITTFSETTDTSEEPANGVSDVVFKSFNCTGGEIEISEGTKLTDKTVPLPDYHAVTSSESYNYAMDPSMLAGDHELQNDDDHLDHPYCNIQDDSSPPRGNLSATQEPLTWSTNAEEVIPDSQAGRQESVTFSSFITAGGQVEKSDDTQLREKTSPPPEDQVVKCQPLDDSGVSTSIAHDYIQDDYNNHLENDEAVVDTDPPATVTNTSFKALDREVDECPEVLNVPEVCSTREPPESSESLTGPALCTSAEKLPAGNLPDVLKVLSEYPAFASGFQEGILSPVIRRASLALLRAYRDSARNQFLDDDFALESEKSLLAPVHIDPTGLWSEHLESPIPCPLFNSTALGYKPQPGPVIEPVENLQEKLCTVPQSEVEKPVLDIPFIHDGPLQQQLRQMAEFLMLASGKMGPTVVSASAPPPAAFMAPSARMTPAESHSVCVGTSPVKLVDHSLNTSGLFERKREFSVVDSCTVTDPLLWNLPPGSLESLPRQELEQRLRSSMIMVEALVQQLAAARAQECPSAGPAPSDLREKLVQTDHTELSQTTMYRDLYMEALSRLGELELDGTSLQNLMRGMQDMRVTMTSLTSDTDVALSNMKEMGDSVREDHQSLVSHYGHMQSLFEKSKETQTRMMQKVKEALHQRNDMRTQMEEAFTSKEAAFSAMEQLRTHCATEISALVKSVGSQQQLLTALNQTYPEQVALNKAYTETLNSASDLLSQTTDEQFSLMKELFTVRSLLQETAPILLKLNEKAAAALRERDEHISARDQAIEEREQTEEELSETHLNLQTAREQISDLNLQVTILTSEMGVLRQKLTEKEEETGQLERTVTELSATVSSTLASYSFLEQALAAETTKLQQSWKDKQQAKERETELETLLVRSEQRVCELSRALAQSEKQLSQLQTFSQSQSVQIQQLQDACTQLNGVREMNEFLQIENELAREQVAESERILRVNLQGLRERNFQCEDLKGEVCQLQLEKRNLQEELETTRSRATGTQLELGETMAQAATEIILLIHTLRGLTNELHAALNDQKPEPQKDKESPPLHTVEHRHPSSSFVDSILVALTAEKEEDVKTCPPAASDMPEPQCETVFSETSAFTCIVATTPKKNLNAAEFKPEEQEQSSVAELLTGLGNTVAELVSTLKLVRQRKDTQLEELHNTICGLQEEQQAANSRHEAEVSELKHQLSRLNSLVDRGNQALQQKAQDEKIVTKLVAEVQEAQEFLLKHKTDNNELRKDAIELRRALKQSKVESQFLREELRKAGSLSDNPAGFMEEKIQLLKELERMKASLLEAEQARVKLLERAKRHQIIHQSNQQKSENELQILNHMINKVRETLLTLPEVVKNCEQLQQLVEYIG